MRIDRVSPSWEIVWSAPVNATQPGLWPSLKVKDPALQITPGNEKSLGSCSYIRINLSIHLKSEQLWLNHIDNLGKLVWASWKRKYTTVQFNQRKGHLSTPTMIFIFLNHFFYSVLQIPFPFQRGWLMNFFVKGKYMYMFWSDRLKVIPFVINHHHHPHVLSSEFMWTVCWVSRTQPCIYLFLWIRVNFVVIKTSLE